jgi:hypothetical protein
MALLLPPVVGAVVLLVKPGINVQIQRNLKHVHLEPMQDLGKCSVFSVLTVPTLLHMVGVAVQYVLVAANALIQQKLNRVHLAPTHRLVKYNVFHVLSVLTLHPSVGAVVQHAQAVMVH